MNSIITGLYLLEVELIGLISCLERVIHILEHFILEGQVVLVEALFVTIQTHELNTHALVVHI
jgi:hypothetical protein